MSKKTTPTVIPFTPRPPKVTGGQRVPRIPMIAFYDQGVIEHMIPITTIEGITRMAGNWLAISPMSVAIQTAEDATSVMERILTFMTEDSGTLLQITMAQEEYDAAACAKEDEERDADKEDVPDFEEWAKQEGVEYVTVHNKDGSSITTYSDPEKDDR